jgi:peroxiredoxin
VTNSGSNQASYTPRIRIDDSAGGALPNYRYQQNVAMAPGSTQLLSFVVNADTPGRFRVTWGDQTGDFTVDPADNTGAAGAGGQTLAPDFTGVDVVTNQKVTLSQFRGKAVLLNFVNYGCDPSVNGVVSNELLAIKQLTQQRTDFVPVSVFCGCCPPDVLRSFAKQNQFNWPWLLDTDSSIVQKYLSYLRNYGYPTLVFVDADGNITGSAGYTELNALSAKLDQVAGQGG